MPSDGLIHLSGLERGKPLGRMISDFKAGFDMKVGTLKYTPMMCWSLIKFTMNKQSNAEKRIKKENWLKNPFIDPFMTEPWPSYDWKEHVKFVPNIHGSWWVWKPHRCGHSNPIHILVCFGKRDLSKVSVSVCLCIPNWCAKTAPVLWIIPYWTLTPRVIT